MELIRKVKEMCHMEKVEFIPLIISNAGFIPNHLKKNNTWPTGRHILADAKIDHAGYCTPSPVFLRVVSS